jgi:hypothetical protein
MNQTKVALQTFLGKNNKIDDKTARTEVTRSLMQLGLPLASFANSTDREDKQEEKVQKFMQENFLQIGNRYFEEGPTVVITYHYNWEKYKCCCCCPRKTMVHAAGDPEVPPADMPVKRKNFVVRFFRGPYFEIITNKIIRWFIIAVVGAVLAVFIYYCTKLEVNDEQVGAI